MTRHILSIMVGAFAFMQSASVFANTLTVTSLDDEFPAATPGTFRYELEHSSAGDTIVFADSIAGGTINMVGVSTADTSFVIAHALTIEGNGVTINGGWNGTPGNASGTRIFLTVADQGKTTIKNLNLVNGHATVWYSTEEQYFLGGAICANSPIRLEGCRLENNCSMDKSDFYSYPDIRGGGAIFATANVEIDSCYFGTNSVHASAARGGAICQVAGSLTVEDTVFDHNSSKIYGGGAVYLHGPVTKATFTNCKLIENSSSNVDRPGGAILSLMTGGEMKFFGCAFRGSNVPSGGRGGAICMYDAYGLSSATAVTAVDCEFSDGCAGYGGALFLAVSSSPLFVNCTFHGNSTATYSAVLQITSAKPYFVNCTVAGSYDRRDGNDCGPLYVGNLNLLNTVFAYNYKGVSSATLSDKYNQGFARICSIFDGYSSLSGSNVPYTLATSMEDLKDAIKLFADYEMVSEGHGYLPDARVTQPTALMPKLSGDEYDTRVVEIDPEGVLASGGYPVRVNADYSYVEYSDDGGKTWKEFFTRTGASKENLTQIAADQRGVPYADGAVPIGAATVASSSGDKVLPQGVIVK